MKNIKEKLAKAVLKEIQTTANREARKNGNSVATKIIEGAETGVISAISYGYRKNTTDEYVPNSYMNKFGWKNCYYQHAEVIVAINPILWAKKTKWEKYLKLL